MIRRTYIRGGGFIFGWLIFEILMYLNKSLRPINVNIKSLGVTGLVAPRTCLKVAILAVLAFLKLSVLVQAFKLD